MSKTKADIGAKALVKNDWPVERRDGLELIFSPLLIEQKDLVHAFTTRIGGASPPPLDAFNLGRHWGTEESRRDALHNRSRLCSVLGLNFARLVVPGQSHSTTVAWVTEPESLPDVDGVVTVTPDTPLLLHYADCVPVIIFDTELSVLAVVHAGWRGTAGGIAAKAVRFMIAVLDVAPTNIVAAVGPAIGSCCYQTKDDVCEKILASVSAKHRQGLVRWVDDSPYPDLKAVNAMQLLELGVGCVDVSSFCTACMPERFYSHRHANGRTGRQGAIASLKIAP